MTKSPGVKTNGHTVAALKPAVPKKAAGTATAVKTAVSKPAAKVAVKVAPKAGANAAGKAPARPAAKKVAVKPAAKSAASASAAKTEKPAARKTATPKATVRKAAAVQAVDTDARLQKERTAKLVRDSFTMPEQEYAVLGQVKKACIKAGFEIKKSELLRIGVALISQLDMATLQQVLASLPQLKTGRPKNE